MPKADDFQTELEKQIERARKQGRPHAEINAGELHRVVGSYPDSNAHRMPLCCEVMRARMGPADQVVHEPPEGKGAALTIRYVFPNVRATPVWDESDR